MQRIFDCHVHIESGFEGYQIGSEKFNVIFNSIDNYRKFEHKVPAGSVISIILDLNTPETVKEICKNDERIRSLKIHARIQRLSKQDYYQIDNLLNDFDPGMSVIYDAFYYGSELEHQPDLAELINLIRNHPGRNFVIAHSGGHKALEYMLHLRPFRNVYFDLSFSLAYLQGTSAELDLAHLIKVTSKDRILFGTDFPHIDAEKQLSVIMSVVEKYKFTNDQISAIVYYNACKLFEKS